MFGDGLLWPQWVSVDALYRDFVMCSRADMNKASFIKAFRAVTSASRRTKQVGVTDSNGKIRYYTHRTVYEVGSLLPP